MISVRLHQSIDAWMESQVKSSTVGKNLIRRLLMSRIAESSLRLEVSANWTCTCMVVNFLVRDYLDLLRARELSLSEL